MRISQPGLVLTLLLLGTTTVAGAPCPEKDRGTLEAWKCFGEVEYTSRTAGEPDFGARFVVFANRERLHDPAVGADVRGNHRLVPAGVTLGDVRRGWRGACE